MLRCRPEGEGHQNPIAMILHRIHRNYSPSPYPAKLEAQLNRAVEVKGGKIPIVSFGRGSKLCRLCRISIIGTVCPSRWWHAPCRRQRKQTRSMYLRWTCHSLQMRQKLPFLNAVVTPLLPGSTRR
jgi:hypothetical protein